jgi:4-hydroxybenzoate polyprenyltransferase
VAASFFFAYCDPAQGLRGNGLKPFLAAGVAMALFIMLSGAVYAFNDLRDMDHDRLHPVKRLRPVASGDVSPRAALTMAVVLSVGSIACAAAISLPLAAVLSAYAALQLLYTLKFKHLPLVDVFVIAFGFVLRAVAGVAVVNARVSPWLLLCTFLLALFLALCKRRQEKATRAIEAQRTSIKSYDIPLLDSLISVAASATIISYSLYTLSAETTGRFGTPLLWLTIPVVIFGVFRYMHLVHAAGEGERPERVLLTDKGIIATVAIYAIVIVAVLVAGR